MDREIDREGTDRQKEKGERDRKSEREKLVDRYKFAPKNICINIFEENAEIYSRLQETKSYSGYK